MSIFAAAVAAAVLLALALLQILLAAGRPYGRFTWGGQNDVLPRPLRIGSAISVLIYAAIAAVLFWRARAGGAAPLFLTVSTWVVVGFFTLGIVMNAISRSRAERMTMTPVSIVLASCALIVAVG